MFSSTALFTALTSVIFLLITDAEDGLYAPVRFTHSVTAAHMPAMKKTQHSMRESVKMHTPRSYK